MQFVLGVDFWTLMSKGGFFVWPILLTAFVGAGIALERMFVLFFRADVNAQVFLGRIQKLVLADDVDRAIKECNAEPQASLPRVVKAALTRANSDESDIASAVDEAVLEVGPVLNKRTGYLPMIANVATLMGLLGTIAGLIQAFAAVAHAPPETKQMLLADGIAVAMYTTAGGLLVAIPTLIAHAMLLQRTNKILDDVDTMSVKVLNLLVARRKGLAARRVASGAAAPAGD